MKHRDTHWLRCLGVLLMSTVLTACAGRASKGDQEAFAGRSSQDANPRETVNVIANGFDLTADRSQVRAGRITFSVKNVGAIPHNFCIQGAGVNQETTRLNSGETARLTIDLQPGVYTYKCTVHFHYLLGMKGILTVTDLAQSQTRLKEDN